MNRITRLLNIRYPVIQAGMIWCSGWESASAVSNAGGLGLIGSGSMDALLLRDWHRKGDAGRFCPWSRRGADWEPVCGFQRIVRTS